MIIPVDKINGAFEALGGVMNLVNVLRIYRDKGYRGISVLPTVVFTVWGFWNLYYYPALGQWFSFTGCVLIVAANAAWVSMAIYYGASEK